MALSRDAAASFWTGSSRASPLHSARLSDDTDGRLSPPSSSAETIIDMSNGTSDEDDSEEARLLRPSFGAPPSTHTHIHHHYHLSTRKPAKSSSSLESVPDYFAAENYRSSALARKLGFSQQPPHKRPQASWFSPRRVRRRDSNREAPPSYAFVEAHQGGATYLESATSAVWSAKWPGQFMARLLRQPYVPTQPLSVLFTAVLLISFFFSATTFISHVLNNDKAPLPWRTFCAQQAPFPHALADSLPPVNVFVGVFSVDGAYERRHLIRSTYLRHSRPLDPKTGRPASNVQLKFILGRPRVAHARRIALEMETYNDMVVLDTTENMNKGKTYAFFKWANENATIPVFYRQPGQSGVNVGFQQADYIVKADDDAFLVLSELERHLRVAPRQQTYWGYLVRNLFMAGEAYALSADLVNYVATYKPLLEYIDGKEDKKVARWMRMHPNATSINWVSERCWIYDHPKAGTIYSHGFLFPNYVERIRLEAQRGLPDVEKLRRGGDWAPSYSTVTEWQKQYSLPGRDMTMEEEVEALVEGGGQWGPQDGWKQEPVPKDQYQDYDKMRFTTADPRLRLPHGLASPRQQRQTLSYDEALHDDSTAASRFSKAPIDLIRDVEEPLFPEDDRTRGMYPVRGVPRQRHAQLPSLVPTEYEHLVPPPTLRYEPRKLLLREQRMLGRPHGGTVVVHFLKRNEWFLETALALFGRHTFWDSGVTPAAYDSPPYNDEDNTDPAAATSWDGRRVVDVVDSRWGTARMYGSPIVRSNGYISEGRESPFERLAQPALKDASPKGLLRGRPKLGFADPDAPSTAELPADASDTAASASGLSSASFNTSAAPLHLPSESASPTSLELEDAVAD